MNLPGHRMAVAGITAALFAFTVQGGTCLVRSVLRTSGSGVRAPATIAKVLGDMESELLAIAARLVKARQLKQGMMQNLLTGKIRLV